MFRGIFSVLMVSVLIFACKNQKEKPSGVSENEVVDTKVKEASSKKVMSGTYFKASGTEPFWGLDISDSKIELKRMDGDAIITPYAEPISNTDTNTKIYQIETEAVELTIQILEQNCTNAMSGEKFPSAVTVDYKYTGEETTHQLKGCGYYTTPLEPGCYAYNADGNELLFQITDVDKEVFGRLKYKYHKKDGNIGNFRGRLYRNRLLGTFSFISEGIESVREVAFLVKQDTLLQGFGTLNETGNAFKFRDSIQYSHKMPLVKTDCK